jgi:xylulokinase
MGERTPHLDPTLRASWVGLTAAHTRADLIRSVLEGVCYSQRDCLDIIASLNVPISSVRLSGGGARSPFWSQLFADILAQPVSLLETQEGSAYGAALLAMTGTAHFATVPEACRATVREVSRLTPSSADFYRPRHARYQALYPALAPLFRAVL